MRVFHTLSLGLFTAGVLSMPISTETTLIGSLGGLPLELSSKIMELQVDSHTRPHLSDESVFLGDGHPSPQQSVVLPSEITSLITSPAVKPVSPLPNTTSRLISHLIIVACIFFVIFLGVLVGFSCMICRYGRRAKQTDEEHNMSKSIRLVSQTSVNELKPMVMEEEQLPRAPSSKRFKRYASGKVPLGSVGPLSTGPPGKLSKQSSRKPSPLRHVYSSASFVSISEVPDSPCSSLYPDSIAYASSDCSSCSVDMAPTPDLDDIVIRKELFDLDDPFACLSPRIRPDSPHNSLKTSTSSVEQDISDAYDSCWIIGEYIDSDDEDNGDAIRMHVHSSWYVLRYIKSDV